MEASGQLHTLATLPPGKELLVPIGEEAGWASEPVWTHTFKYCILILTSTRKNSVPYKSYKGY